MAREVINPQTLHESTRFGFSHVVVSRSPRQIHCAGQVAWDRNLSLVGRGDLATQIEQALENTRLALASAGAGPQDVVRMHTYLVGHRPENLAILGPALARFYGGHPPAANTVIGVQSLALPDFLVEIEVTAVID